MEGLLDQRRYLIPFRSGLLPQIFTDTLVIGAGVAGLRAGIAACEHGEVIVLAKGELKNTNTAWAQGGIAGVLDERDTLESHVQDTLVAGAGACDESAVRLTVEHAPARLRELFEWGLNYDRDASGKPALGREGGHAAPRIIHAGGDETGRELERTLADRYRSLGAARLFENCFALDLITPSTEPGSPVMGAITHHPKYGLQVIWARATILASGGAGVLYRETTNPPQATADGLAMAYRAGATLADMAYVQFHPTTLYLAGASRSLITEAIRGAGAHLLDGAGLRFMIEVHPLAELAPRDIVSRAIVRQIAKQGGSHVWLDCRHVAEFKSRFPGIAALLKRFQIDPAKDLIPVHPAAHYMVGGVRTDLHGRTDIPGLYAIGEVACSGLHGANRLASNSLLEGLVFGEIVGREAGLLKSGAGNGTRPNGANGGGWGAWGTMMRQGPVPVISDIRPSERAELDLSDVRSSLRSAMWKNVGIERSGQRLTSVVEMIDFWARYTLDKIFDDPAGWETQNMLLAASLVARSAAWREESRGCHSRDDFPEPRDEFRVHDLWRRGREGPVTQPVHALVGADA
ncbi:L-aspartate oxidase [Phycisphaerales bacterium]|nr:L-aspartate oxidase [Phycisphaerales bacterium]